ncbi:MAG: nuclear transport factor 2 family protein [Pseudomonadota bacterium]
MSAKEIDAVNANLMAHVEAGSATKIAALYHDEASLVTSGSAPFQGRAAIQGFFQAAIDGGIKKLDLKTLDLEDHGETAIEFGQYRLLADADQIADHGHFIVVWKRSGGIWQLYRDVISTDQS